ncbi:MAG: hypothetical protein R3B84_14395 [Zavarzinella sp.]
MNHPEYTTVIVEGLLTTRNADGLFGTDGPTNFPKLGMAAAASFQALLLVKIY